MILKKKMRRQRFEIFLKSGGCNLVWLVTDEKKHRVLFELCELLYLARIVFRLFLKPLLVLFILDRDSIDLI